MTQPPSDLHASAAGSTAFLVIAIVFVAVCGVWIARNFSRVGWLPVILMGGGVIASLEESLIDRMILLQYPSDAPLVPFSAVGVPQPLYLIIIYAGFVGMGTYFAYATARDRPGRLWLVFLGVIVMDAGFEIFATAANVYAYYGTQPFQIVPHGWSLWVAPLSAAAPVLAGWIVFHAERRLAGAERVVLVLIPPFAWAAVYFATGWPTFITINSDVPAGVVWGAAVVTMAMCAGLVQLLVAFSRPAPAAAEPALDTHSTRLVA